MSRKPKKIMAVASGGGHWVQLLRLRPTFVGHSVSYVTVNPAYASDVEGAEFHVITDATRWNKWRLAKMFVEIAWLILRYRPDVIVSTGAAPGYCALRFGKLVKARTIWIDSMANVERLSMSGLRIGRHADLWLTQWPHLAQPGGPQFKGRVW